VTISHCGERCSARGFQGWLATAMVISSASESKLRSDNVVAIECGVGSGLSISAEVFLVA
jgi:hypothetical protein